MSTTKQKSNPRSRKRKITFDIVEPGPSKRQKRNSNRNAKKNSPQKQTFHPQEWSDFSSEQAAEYAELIEPDSDSEEEREEYWQTRGYVGTCEIVHAAKCNCASKGKQCPNPAVGSCSTESALIRLPNWMSNEGPSHVRHHQAALIVAEIQIPLGVSAYNHAIDPAQRMTISHRCGRGLCKNIDHLFIESFKTNMERIKCHEFMRVNHLNRMPNCRHRPYCIWNDGPLEPAN